MPDFPDFIYLFMEGEVAQVVLGLDPLGLGAEDSITVISISITK